MSVTPEISIVVSIYNVEKYLAQCIQSLIGQTFGDIEIILVNDGSTDGSLAIMKHFATLDNRIVLIDKPNSGYGDSMNHGISVAKGKWIAICEPDDFADLTMCEQLLEAAQSYERSGAQIDLVKASYNRVTRAETNTPRIVPAFYLHVFKPEHQPFTIYDHADFLFYHPSIWTVLYKRSFLTENSITFRPIPGAGWADNPFFIETMLSAKAIVYLDEPVYYYREFDDGTLSHLKDFTIIFNRWKEMCEIVEKHHVSNFGVLEGHYCRGCAYIEMIDADFDTTDPNVMAAIHAMVNSMEGSVIRKSKRIIPEFKEAYYKYAPIREKLLWKLQKKLSHR